MKKKREKVLIHKNCVCFWAQKKRTEKKTVKLEWDKTVNGILSVRESKHENKNAHVYSSKEEEEKKIYMKTTVQS